VGEYKRSDAGYIAIAKDLMQKYTKKGESID
jgi:hypothetical protein